MSGRFVYFMRPVGQRGPVKIGYSYEPEQRLQTYQLWSPLPLEIVATIKGDHTLERQFHAQFERLRLHHEWSAADDELDRAIEEIATGAFDVRRLPPPEALTAHSGWTSEVRAYCGDAARIHWMRRRGAPVPEHVLAACEQHGLSSDEKAKRRAIVRAFVASVQSGAPA